MSRLPLGRLLAGAAMAPLLVASIGLGAAYAGQISLNETGSTLLYPLFNEWVPAYTHLHPNVKITTSGTGSGTGISYAVNGTVQIGASDAYMATALMANNPGMLNIPLAISAQQVNFNIPGLNNRHINLSGPVLALIYTGKITNWNAKQIAQMNPGVKFPNMRIIPIHRSDGSGDTFIFTQYLSFSNLKTWGGKNGPQYGTSISWPAVQGSVSANGNQGVVQALAQTRGGVAYVGVSWLNNTIHDHLGEAMLKNRAGKFLLPTPATIAAAAKVGVKHTPKSERISLIFATGAQSYPIINYEYAIVNSKQANQATANAVRALLDWGISTTGGNSAKFLGPVHFLALPPSVFPLSAAQIQKIH